MRILGIGSMSHDAGVALLEDSRIAVVLEEERHNREKHTLQFPHLTLKQVLGEDGAGLAGIDTIVTPWDPRRLKRSFGTALLRRFPMSLALALPAAQTPQDGGIAFLNWWLRYDLRREFPHEPLPPVVNVGHHEAHAAMFLVSPFEDATIVVVDGHGDDASTSVFTGEGNRIERRWHGRFFDSVGMLYTFVTRHLGFEMFEEGTVMALAALGSGRLVEELRKVVRLEPDGSFAVDMSWFSYDVYGMISPFRRKFLDAFGPPRRRHEPLTDHHRDLAFALQTVAEDIVLNVVRSARRQWPSRNLVLAGGVALNCVANARIAREAGFDRVWVPPCASDTGVPLGATLWHQHITLGAPRNQVLDHAYWGLEHGPDEIEAALRRAGMAFETMDEAALIDRVAGDLAEGRIVGWYQGRDEIGPRALGNRSILASPIGAEVRERINTRVKFREPFRPFAPAVLAEAASDWFELSGPDPFMTMAPRVRSEKAARIPAAVHVDGTARVQTVERSANPRFHALIAAFGHRTGVPILINTSFNKQEPIVQRPEHAISCFLRTDMDVLVLGERYVTERPAGAVERARAAFEVKEVNTRGGE